MMSLFNLQRFATQKGTSSADNLVVKKAGNVVYGYAGNDNIINNYDKVTIVGGADKDNIWSHGDSVKSSGDAGNDVLIVSGRYNQISGGAGTDSIFSSGYNATVAITPPFRATRAMITLKARITTRLFRAVKVKTP